MKSVITPEMEREMAQRQEEARRLLNRYCQAHQVEPVDFPQELVTTERFTEWIVSRGFKREQWGDRVTAYGSSLIINTPILETQEGFIVDISAGPDHAAPVGFVLPDLFLEMWQETLRQGRK